MPKNKTEEPKLSKQFILDHLDEDEVDLSMCNLPRVPVKELAMVPRGTKLDLSRNQLESLPDNFCTLKHLTELDLSNNALRELPANFGDLPQLQRLDLYSNHLGTLPLSFWQLRKLKWLDLRNNELEAGLAEAAGMCLSEKECREGAKKVLAYVKQLSVAEERRRQREVEEQREARRREEEEEKKRREVAKRERAELRRRRREEQERAEQERRGQEEGEDEEESGTESAEVVTPVNTRRPSRFRCFCKFFLLLLILLAAVAVVGLLFICDRVFRPTACQELKDLLFQWVPLVRKLA